MSPGLSLAELARRLGEEPERVRAWQARGLLGGDEPVGARAIASARLVQFLLRQGVPLEELARAFADELAHDVERYLDIRYPPHDPPVHTLEEACARIGIPPDTARRMTSAVGIADGDQFLCDEDVAALGWWATAIDAGMPEDAVLQLVRVYRETLARVAEAESRLFHFYVHEPLRATGLEGEALAAATLERTLRVAPIIEPALRYFHRLALAEASKEDMLLHVGPSVVTRAHTPAQMQLAIVFTDLSSFTPLAEAMGDEAAIRVVQRFGALVHEAAARWTGRVVKQIGDAAMLVFFDAQAAVSFALDIVGAVRVEPTFPAARSGVHWGAALYRDGDYFGAAVNLAARLVAVAGRHEVIVSSAVRERAAEIPAVEFRPRGPTALKGVAEAPELFEAVRRDVEHAARLRDLVCGMELAPGEVAARLVLGDAERVFCSESCLRRFVASPEQYLSRARG
jgi:adenylate cyclase